MEVGAYRALFTREHISQPVGQPGRASRRRIGVRCINKAGVPRQPFLTGPFAAPSVSAHSIPQAHDTELFGQLNMRILHETGTRESGEIDLCINTSDAVLHPLPFQPPSTPRGPAPPPPPPPSSCLFPGVE